MKKLGVICLFFLGCLFHSSSQATVWLGAASDSHVTRSADPALSALFKVSPESAAQLYTLISTVNPFTFALGANYKVTLVGNLANGFHVGGGFGLGRFGNRQFFVRFQGILGLHFTLAKRVLILADTGVTLGLDDSQFELLVGGHSTLLGLSLLYRI